MSVEFADAVAFKLPAVMRPYVKASGLYMYNMYKCKKIRVIVFILFRQSVKRTMTSSDGVCLFSQRQILDRIASVLGHGTDT